MLSSKSESRPDAGHEPSNAPTRRGSLTNMLFKRRSSGSGIWSSSGSINDSVSEQPSTKDSNGAGESHPNFIYVTADKDFHKPSLSALGTKSHAEVLEGKLYRKTGSSRVLPLSEACSPSWAPRFYPAPSLHTLYRKHPFTEGRYIGVRQFHRVIFDEKRQEICLLLRGLGAKSISWMDGGAGAGGAEAASEAPSPSWSRQFEEPDSYGPEADEEGLVFLACSPAWREVIRERFASWPDSTTFVFTYDDDFGLTDDLVNVLFAKLQIPPAQFWAGEDDSTNLIGASGQAAGSTLTSGVTGVTGSAAMKGRRIFHTHSVPVQVVYFSRQEYMEHNRRRIASGWTAFHLEAFLKVSGLSRCLKLIMRRNVSVPTLLSVTSTKELNTLLNFRDKDSLTCMTLFSKLRSLGDPHDAELLSSIDVEAHRLLELRLPEGAREEDLSDTSSVVSAVSADSTSHNAPRSQGPSSQDAKAAAAAVTTTALHILDEDTVAAVDPAEEVALEELEPAEYTLVMVGSSGVGKTSLLRQLVAITVRQRVGGEGVTSIASPGGSPPPAHSDFDEHELPTVGAQLLRCSIGRVAVESWDTSGQDSQRRAVLMHTKRADIIFFVYDVRSSESLEHLRTLAKDIIRNGCVPWVSLCLLANKADINDRKVSIIDGIEFAKEYGFSNFFETSARTGLNVYSALLNSVLKCEQGRRAASHRRSFADAISLDAMYRGAREPSRALSEHQEEEEEAMASEKSKGWSCC